MNLPLQISSLKRFTKELRKNQLLLAIGLLTTPAIIGLFLIKPALAGIRYSKEGIAKSIRGIEYSIIGEFNRINEKIESRLCSDAYVTTREIEIIICELNNLLENFSELGVRVLKKNKELLDSREKVRISILATETRMKNFCQELIQRHSTEYDGLFNAGEFPLDLNQRVAVITDDEENLVVAGAGSGKTEVLITRIAYIINRQSNNSTPDRILALAYTRKSRDEMRVRLQERFKADVDIRTFHSLGQEILKQGCKIDGVRPFKVFSDNQNDQKRKKIIQQLVQELSKDKDFSRKITNFISLHPHKEATKSKDDFVEESEYIRYMEKLRYHALDGTEVKSLSERRILNFLLTHSIDGKRIVVKYEEPADWMRYEIDGEERIPSPDFLLPEYELYIEHWAVDRNGNVPDWFSGDDPSADYHHGMQMKKDRFLEQDTYHLIETFEYEAREQDIEEVLQQKLLSFLHEMKPHSHHEISPLPYDDVRRMIVGGRNDAGDSLEDLVLSFIIKAKANFQNTDEIRERLEEPRWDRRQRAFAEIALDVLDGYNKELRDAETIDFDDMIVLATQMLIDKPSLMTNRFDHILIDEYQDISPLRFDLILTLLAKNDKCHMFCVGDDWQSIMGFSGSDVSYFIDFKNLFPLSTIRLLETNYRSNSSIVEAGAISISHNKDQITKLTRSNIPSQDVNIRVISTNRPNRNVHNVINRMVVSMVASLLRNGHRADEIMILSRIVNCRRVKDLVIQAGEAGVPISDEFKHHGHVPVMSIHRSKGLQARTVIILDATEGEYGLPSTKRTSTLLEPAIRSIDNDPMDEERRLFYVALTRAKEKVLIYVDSNSPRPFIDEISENVELIFA